MILVDHIQIDILVAYCMIFQFLIDSEVFTKKQFYRKICGDCFCFLGNVLIGVYTTYMYIQKINNFRLVVCSPALLP